MIKKRNFLFKKKLDIDSQIGFIAGVVNNWEGYYGYK